MNLKQSALSNLNELSRWMPGVFLWKKDVNSVYTEINQECAHLFGLKKKGLLSSFTDYEIPCKISDYADTFRQQDQQVLASGNPLKILEVHFCSNNEWKVMLNTKNPLLDINNHVIGTFAYCIDITNLLGPIQNLLTSLYPFKQSNNNLTSGSYILHQCDSTTDLTNRQMDCLFYLIRGKTSKEIAEILKLSVRTIEHYVEQIKDKFFCRTKSELIDLAISKGFMNVIPKCLYKQLGAKSITEEKI
jgi:DNA-binding CsgD family transcriptional regulator